MDELNRKLSDMSIGESTASIAPIDNANIRPPDKQREDTLYNLNNIFSGESSAGGSPWQNLDPFFQKAKLRELILLLKYCPADKKDSNVMYLLEKREVLTTFVFREIFENGFTDMENSYFECLENLTLEINRRLK